MTHPSRLHRRLRVLGIALVVLASVSLVGCSPARKESHDAAYRAHSAAPTGAWPGLSPSTPREKPARKREPRRYGRRAIALHELLATPYP